MTAWRFRAYDLLTRDFLTEVPVVSWTGTDGLKQAGTFTADVVLDGAKAGEKTVNIDGTPTTISTARRRVIADALATEPAGRTVLVAERNGVPMAPSGIVWDWGYSSDRPGILTVKGEGLLSFFDGFAQREDLTPANGLGYSNVDQLAIFRDLVDRCRTRNTAAAFPLEVHAETSGVLRTRNDYVAVDSKTYGELLRELSDVENGFDFDFRTEYVSGAMEWHLRLWYPRRGRSIVSTPDKVPRFRVGAKGNATVFSVSSGTDGFNRPANIVYALGAGDGDDMVRTSASQSDLLEGGWPGYTTTRAWKDVKNVSTLQQHADAAVQRLSKVDGAIYTLEIDPEYPATRWGSWDLGDDCQVIVHDDLLYPENADGVPGVVRSRRVLGHTVSVDATGERFLVATGKRVIP